MFHGVPSSKVPVLSLLLEPTLPLLGTLVPYEPSESAAYATVVMFPSCKPLKEARVFWQAVLAGTCSTQILTV